MFYFLFIKNLVNMQLGNQKKKIKEKKMKIIEWINDGSWN